jgi:hypothetical protein
MLNSILGIFPSLRSLAVNLIICIPVIKLIVLEKYPEVSELVVPITTLSSINEMYEFGEVYPENTTDVSFTSAVRFEPKAKETTFSPRLKMISENSK